MTSLNFFFIINPWICKFYGTSQSRIHIFRVSTHLPEVRRQNQSWNGVLGKRLHSLFNSIICMTFHFSFFPLRRSVSGWDEKSILSWGKSTTIRYEMGCLERSRLGLPGEKMQGIKKRRWRILKFSIKSSSWCIRAAVWSKMRVIIM